MITESRDIEPTLDCLETALEATCAALMTLESARLGAHDGARDTSSAQAQIRIAITSLREAISAMRDLHDAETSMLAFGFVLARRRLVRPARAHEEPRGRQARPRRTA